MYAYRAELFIRFHPVDNARLRVPAMHAHVGVLVPLAQGMCAVRRAYRNARWRARCVGKCLNQIFHQRALFGLAAVHYDRPALLVQTCGRGRSVRQTCELFDKQQARHIALSIAAVAGFHHYQRHRRVVLGVTLLRALKAFAQHAFGRVAVQPRREQLTAQHLRLRVQTRIGGHAVVFH